MAYNSYFPAGYQPYMYQQPVTPQYGGQSLASEQFSPQGQGNTPQSAGGAQSAIIWVQGEAGARGYPVAPNATVQLWDSEAQTIYLKSADASGMPSMKIIDYTIRDSAPHGNILQKQQVDLSGYVTREEFEKAIADLKVAEK